MAVSLLVLAVLASQREKSAPTTIETLYEVPARFASGCPIIAVDLTSETKGRQSLELILDSGTTRSILLNESDGLNRKFEQGHRGVLIPGKSAVYAGTQDFAAPDLDQFNQDMVTRLLRLHVQGMLGADFMGSHDVLVDYGAQRVFLSKPIDVADTSIDPTRWRLIGFAPDEEGPQRRASSTRLCLVDAAPSAKVQLSRRGQRAYVDAVLSAGGPHWDMRLDTWATRSTLPEAVATGLKRTGVTEHVSAAGTTFTADQVEATVSVSPEVDLDLKPVVTQQVESIIGSDAFQGRTILIQLPHGRMRLWAESVWNAFNQPAQPQQRSN